MLPGDFRHGCQKLFRVFLNRATQHQIDIACFDEESQHMLEGSAEPTLGVVFSPQKPEEVRRALRGVGRFIALNHELFQLVEILAESEKCHAGTYLDRREPSLRAA